MSWSAPGWSQELRALALPLLAALSPVALQPQPIGGLVWLGTAVPLAVARRLNREVCVMAAVARPTGRSAAPRVIRVMNPLVRGLLRSRLHPLASGRLLVLTYRGRRTGRSFSTPVAYLEDGGDLLVAGGAPWWRNVRHGSRVQVRLRGRDVAATADCVTDPEAAGRALASILPRNPTLGRFMQLRADAGGSVSAADVERALARGLRIVRLHPERVR